MTTAALASRLPRWTQEVGWRTLLVGVLLGGIVHICATFAAPVFGSGLAYTRLSDSLPPNRMVTLPAQGAGQQILPFLAPDTLYAMCRFDVAGGPVAVKATVSGPGWVLSLHTREGDNFYVLPGRQLTTDEVSFLLVPSSTVDGTHETPQAVPASTRVVTPAAEGLIVVRAPIIGTAWTAETEAVLRQASCTPVKR